MNLEGRIINFLGDSITEGHGVNDCANNRYDSRIKAQCKLRAANNYGIGGTRIAHQIHPSERPRYDLCFCGRAYNLDPSADIIVVYGGVNDYIHGDAPFGEMTDTTPATFCGGVEFLMNILKELYPEAKLVFMTPAKCTCGLKSPDAKTLKEYVNVIEEKGKAHNIPVLNLYEKLPIDATKDDDRVKYTTDGLHFNDDGHKFIADLLIDFLKEVN